VLTCADALRAAGAQVEVVVAASDGEIDAVLKRFDAAPRADGLDWPTADTGTRLVVAAATDGQLRAVVRRLVRRYAPPPSRRPTDLADDRTVPDLPPLAILPLETSGTSDLAAQLGLPRDPGKVAAAVLRGETRRLDLLRNDGGSVTVDGALVGGADEQDARCPGAAASRSTARSSPTAPTRSWPARSATAPATPNSTVSPC
jgi:diacylglycerol kinase family enzyme